MFGLLLSSVPGTTGSGDARMHQFFAGHHLPDRSEHDHVESERNGSRDRGEYVLHRGGAGPDARTISARNARRIRSAAGSVVFGFVRCNLENEIATAMGHIFCGTDPDDRRNVGLRQLAEIAGRTSYAAGKLSAGGDGNGAERLNLERESDADGVAVARGKFQASSKFETIQLVFLSGVAPIGKTLQKDRAETGVQGLGAPGRA